ncbi:OmpA family protein [Polaribacter sp.]|nr:OmpA family protein [Polaribacter sp.]
MSYFATDLHLKYSFWSAQFEVDKNFNFYLLGGLGSFKVVNNSLSYNVGFGSVYWLNDIVGFNIESIAKWSSNNVRYDSNHFQYFVGISFRLQRAQDSDKDGVADKDDACPNVYGFAALQGCPDSDNDGIVDAQDACPDVAGNDLTKGCPDSDGDGIVDAKDACKYTSGPQENKGCPYKDTDDDGVLDKDDNCPKVKGILSESGCPKEVEKLILDNTAAKLKINKVLKEYPKNIYFQTVKATFTDEVYTALHSIVMELKEFPSSKIVIEGHADSIGSYAANKMLSDKRANAIKDYLVQNGIPLQNIETIGYGERKPVANNTFKAGRVLNRRGHIKFKEL